MKRMIQTGWLLASLVVVMSCNDLDKSTSKDTTTIPSTQHLTNLGAFNSSPKTHLSNDIYTNAAVEICQCLQPIVEKVKHLKESEQNKQTVEKKKTAAEVAAMQPQIQKCCDEVNQKYKKMNKAIDENRIIQALLGQCPDASTLFSNLPNSD